MVDKTLDISDEDIDKIEKRCNIKLAARQREALEKAAQHGVVVITGTWNGKNNYNTEPFGILQRP